MPLISLLTPPPVPHGWHRINSPGGYEWWNFAAEDPNRGLRIFASIFDGMAFHPRYLRAYSRYRRCPTRVVPPLPCHYRGVSFAIYENDQEVGWFVRRYPLAEFEAQAARLDVRIGDNRVCRADDGTIRLNMWSHTPGGGAGRKAVSHFTPKGCLTFQALGTNESPAVRLAPHVSGGHAWIAADPFCQVRGDIQWFDRKTSRPRASEFDGAGFHDQRYGTAPLIWNLKNWIDGHALFGETGIPFQVTQSRGGGPLEGSLFSENLSENAGAEAVWSRRSLFSVAYPSRLKVGGLELRNPRVIRSSLFDLRMIYDAELNGRRGSATCRIISAQRLRGPMMGRIIERSRQSE